MAVTIVLPAESMMGGAEEVGGLFGLLNVATLVIFAGVNGLTSVLNVTCAIGVVGIVGNPCDTAAELSAFEGRTCWLGLLEEGKGVSFSAGGGGEGTVLLAVAGAATETGATDSTLLGVNFSGADADDE